MKLSFRSMILCASMLAAGVSSAAAEEQHGRLYAGVGVGSLSHESYYDGVSFRDRSAGMDIYGGYHLRGVFAIELALERFDHLDVHNIAGSGMERLDVAGSLDAATVRLVATIPVSDYFHWRRRFELLGTAGYGQTMLHRDVLELGVGPLAPLPERRRGTTFGVGVLYALRKVDLRGYLERLGVNHDRQASGLNLAVEFRF